MIATTFENIAETETPEEEKKQSWLQSAFNAVAGGLRSFDNWLEYQFTSDAVRAFDKGQKNSEIDYLLLSVFFDNEIKNGDDLISAVEKVTKQAEEEGTLYYGINNNDLLARYAVISDEQKTVLNSGYSADNWKEFYNEWEDQKHTEYLKSDTFIEDKKIEMDLIINERVRHRLSSMSDEDKLVLFEHAIQSLCTDVCTPDELLQRYNEVGQNKDSSNYELENGDIEEYKIMILETTERRKNIKEEKAELDQLRTNYQQENNNISTLEA